MRTKFLVPAWAKGNGAGPEDAVVHEATGPTICIFPDNHVAEAGGRPVGRHGRVGYLAGAEVEALR